MLPMDALQLATELCPEAIHVRVRFDCSTHHGILEPLVGLKKLKHLSTVCVTNGELSLLDFTDIEPVLQQHGEQLRFLELKVKYFLLCIRIGILSIFYNLYQL